MADQPNAGELAYVLPEYQQLFQEIFLDEDSDEFEGFDIDDIDNIPEERTGLNENNWVEGSKEPSTFTFTGNAGINTGILPVPEEGSLSFLDYFECFVTDTILEKIVEETNRYAATYLQAHPDLPSHSRYRKWTDTTLGEMKAFIGMTIAMGLVQQMDIQDYWSNNVVVNTPFFRSVMSRDRFLSLLSVLHLADNAESVHRGQPGYSPLQKLGDPYKDIISKFQSCYNPSKNIAIDEGMIPWRGNLHFRVYSPDKPIKYGLRVYMLCDSDNGYCSRMELYTGHTGQARATKRKKKVYEDALQMYDNKLGIIERYEDEPENSLRARKAMLHFVCQGTDPTGKDFRKKVHQLVQGNNDIPRHDDVYMFDEDKEDQDCTDGPCCKEGEDVADNIPRTADQEQQGNMDDFRYAIGKQRLAVYIGVGQFEKRALNGESDGTGAYDDSLNRVAEERRDRKEAKFALEKLGFTFIGNEETDKKNIDEFIEKVLKDDVNEDTDVIMLLISSHGEEFKEQDEHNKNKTVLRHRILLEDKHLYTDELLKRFNTSALKGKPKLFFIQTCRSGFDANKEDVVDEGTEVLVEGSSEAEKAFEDSRSDGPIDISDARPRNLKPKVTIEPKPGTEETVATKEANIPHVKAPSDTPPAGGDLTVSGRDEFYSQKDESDALPRTSDQKSGTVKPIQIPGGAKPHVETEILDEPVPQSKVTPEVKLPANTPMDDPLKDNSNAKKTTDLVDVRTPKPAVDTTVPVLPQQEIPSITCIEDSLVMFASAPGKESYRRLKEGGWLMQTVVKELEIWPQDQDLLQVLTRVIGKIAIEKETKEGYKSAACLTHMLTKDVYLCQGK